MALVPSMLQTKLTAIFDAMNSMTAGGDRYFADEAAKEIKAYILGGQVSTTDTGAAPAGSYTGAGAGAMTINDGVLESALRSTFEAAYGNDDLAAHMAADIDNVCKADNTVSTVSTGIVTTPSGVTTPFSGPGKGKFTGSKAIMETALKACFLAMNNMSTGGNGYLAAHIASAIDTCLKAGSISVILKAPFASGSGTGAVA